MIYMIFLLRCQNYCNYIRFYLQMYRTKETVPFTEIQIWMFNGPCKKNKTKQEQYKRSSRVLIQKRL